MCDATESAGRLHENYRSLVCVIKTLAFRRPPGPSGGWIVVAEPTPLDLLEKQAIEKYGNRPPPMYPLDSDAYWAFDPTGKPLPEGPASHPNPLWGECAFKGLVVGTGGGGLDQVLHFYGATVIQLFSTKTIRYEASAPLRNEFWANWRDSSKSLRCEQHEGTWLG